jgi:acetyl-CoA acetyltransferase
MQDNPSYGVIYGNRSNRLDDDRDSLTAADARSGGRYGIATACIGGGQGIAVIIESI